MREAGGSPRGIPRRLNLALFALFALAGGTLFLLLPLYLLPKDPRFALLLLPIVLTTNTNWSLLHEALHGVLHPSRRVNEGLGRALGVLFGAPFEALRMGHLLHHRLNSSVLDRPEVYDPGVERRGRYALRYYFQLLIGLYVEELASAVFVLLPRRFGRWALERFAPGDGEALAYRRHVERRLYAREPLRRARTDAALIVLLFGGAFLAYGERWPLLLLALMGRGFLVSFMDNSYHYGGPLNDVYAASNARAPWWWSALLLNFNLHRVHHRHPRVSWYRLPEVFREEGDGYAEGHFRMALRQLRGPIARQELPDGGRGEPSLLGPDEGPAA